jgi:ATP synthase protein I
MQNWLLALKFIGVGWYVGLAILLGVLGGVWLDGKLGTRPFFIIVGLFAGLGCAFYGVYLMIMPFIGNKQGKGE